MTTRRSLTLHLLLLGAAACAADSRAARVPPREAAARPLAAEAADSMLREALAARHDTGSRRAPKPRALTDDEQRVADGLVFAPSVTERFLVASRNKRLLVDVGRVDLEVKQDAKLLALVKRVSARVGPLARATHVRVRGSWGEETDSITGYDVWNGRAVAVLAPSARADSLLRRNAALVGVATRLLPAVDSASATPAVPAVVATCARDSVAAGLPARVGVVRDSLLRWVSDSLKPSYAVNAKLAVRADTVSGCFAAWRAVVVVSTRTPMFDWSEERTLLVAPDGKPVTGRLRDLRLRTHESLVAFDADGDGIDELATRGLAPRMGAQSVLKLDPTTRRFGRYASGFAWEAR